MAFENLKSTGIKYLLGKIRDFLSETYVKIADSVRSVNEVTPDGNGNITIDTVQYAQNLQSESSQRNVETFIQRTSGGSAPIENGDGWLMLLRGNSVHEGFVPESIVMTVIPAERGGGDEDEPTPVEEPITATIDRDTFVAYVSESGTTNLVYSTQWSADPTLYGITVTGTPIAGDMITVVYVKEVRGTITVATPSKFVSTGWNLYDNTVGYAKVVKYAYGYMISGTYTSLKYAATPTGTQIDITVTDGAFNIPDDGYILVTGGNGTDTAIFPYWTDWTGGYEGAFSVYNKGEIDLSGLFGEGNPFPYGLLKVSDVADEIDLNIGQATSRVDRMEYTEENLATAKASGRAYEYDENYIYIARATVVTTPISVDGSVMCDDHGIEYFEDTQVPIYTELLYGNNLKNKLEMNVLTISQQTLTDAQKTQVRANIGAASVENLGVLKFINTPSSMWDILNALPNQGDTSVVFASSAISSEFGLSGVIYGIVCHATSAGRYDYMFAKQNNYFVIGNIVVSGNNYTVTKYPSITPIESFSYTLAKTGNTNNISTMHNISTYKKNGICILDLDFTIDSTISGDISLLTIDENSRPKNANNLAVLYIAASGDSRFIYMGTNGILKMISAVAGARFRGQIMWMCD